MTKIEIKDLQQDVSKKAADVKGGDGLPTGKRQHKPLSVVNPRDLRSGMPTGKR